MNSIWKNLQSSVHKWWSLPTITTPKYLHTRKLNSKQQTITCTSELSTSFLTNHKRILESQNPKNQFDSRKCTTNMNQRELGLGCLISLSYYSTPRVAARKGGKGRRAVTVGETWSWGWAFGGTPPPSQEREGHSARTETSRPRRASTRRPLRREPPLSPASRPFSISFSSAGDDEPARERGERPGWKKRVGQQVLIGYPHIRVMFVTNLLLTM